MSLRLYIYKGIILFGFLLCNRAPVSADEHNKEAVPEAGIGKYDFVENKGQWAPEARYKADLPYGTVFITDHGFVYHYIDAADREKLQQHLLGDIKAKDDPEDKLKQQVTGSQPGVLHHHAYKVNFVGAHTNTTYSTAKQRKYYHNYIIGNDTAKWATAVPVYGEIKQRNIYDGIDMVAYSKGDRLKYDFIITPGADPNQIALSFEGVRPEITKEGHLEIRTSVNKIIEEAPYAYQVIGAKTVAVRCNYRLSGNILSFDFPNGFDKHYPLVIDPSVVFAGYSGAQANIQGSACTTYDNDGNFYMAGIAGYTGWPVTIGAFQTSGFDSDIILGKYDASGANLLYATYYGGYGLYGLGFDYPHAIQVNNLGEIIMVGSTCSFDLPVTQGCFQTALKSGGYNSTVGQDLFVAHFNAAGTALVGATFIGGYHTEALIAIGDVGVFVPKISPAEIALDASGNIWVTSTVVSTDFPTTPNAIQPQPYNLAYLGDPRCVVFQLNPDCSQLLYSTYLSGSGASAGWDIIFNHAGNLVICGSSEYYDFPVTPDAMQPTFLGGSIFSYEHTDGFVAVIDPVSGSLLHATFLGTTRRDHAFFVQVDGSDNVYVLGRTLGNYPVSPGLFAVPDGDIFVHKLNPDLSVSLFSTRLGNHVGANTGAFIPTGFMVDACENLYITGYNAGDSLPVTNDAFAQDPRSFWVGVFKPAFSGLLFGSYFGSAPPQEEHLYYGGVNRSDPRGIIYQSATTVSNTFPATPGSFAQTSATTGTDIVCFKLDLSGFANKDTLVTQQELFTCFADSMHLQAVNPGFLDYTWNNGFPAEALDVGQSGNYAVTYRKETGCGLFIDSFRVRIYPVPGLTVHDKSCPEAKEGSALAQVSPANMEHYSYTWYDTYGTVLGVTTGSSGAAIQDLDPGNYNLRIQTEDGCDTTVPFMIEALPGVMVTAGNDTTISGKAFVPLWADGADYYQWKPDSWLNNATIPNPIATPAESVVYTVTGSNQYGCRASATVTINVLFRPFMPNAFSPNGDNRNDVFKIVNPGFGQLLEFLVFNRWGEKVFETLDPEAGWDGTYKGQPSDVGTYHYYIRLALQDGSIKTYKGDVTLIR